MDKVPLRLYAKLIKEPTTPDGLALVELAPDATIEGQPAIERQMIVDLNAMVTTLLSGGHLDGPTSQRLLEIEAWIRGEPVEVAQ